ncbi:MAG: hypothetical protein K6B72_03965 [Lachnospiraceae bacterium]|nr:hypothetical protein [Lachnospiraceae bacterium]
MNYRVIDKGTYYRSGVFRHFTEDCKCSTSMTARIDVTDLVRHSKKTGTRFYINFLYVLSKVLNSRDDYKNAIADGFLVANVYRLLEKEITAFCGKQYAKRII